MALSLILGEAGLTADKMDTKAVVTLEQQDGGFAVTASKLTLQATIPGTDDAQFQELAAKAKANCPISAWVSSMRELRMASRRRYGRIKRWGLGRRCPAPDSSPMA